LKFRHLNPKIITHSIASEFQESKRAFATWQTLNLLPTITQLFTLVVCGCAPWLLEIGRTVAYAPLDHTKDDNSLRMFNNNNTRMPEREDWVRIFGWL